MTADRPCRSGWASLACALVAALVGAAAGSLAAEKAPAAAAEPQDVRELWVPAENLDAVLKKYPRAVLLSADEYASLLRESGVLESDEAKDKQKPPVAALIGEVSMTGELRDEVAVIRAVYSVRSFVDEWSEIPLVLPRERLARISVDGDGVGAVRPLSTGKKGQQTTTLQLLVSGTGDHVVSAEFHLPIERSASGNAIHLSSPGVAATKLELTVGAGIELDSALPFSIAPATQAGGAVTAHFAFPAAAGDHEIRWAARDIAAIPGAAIFQSCSYLYSIDAARVQGDLGIVLSSSLADLPIAFAIALPAEVRVLSVEGSEVLRWDRDERGVVQVKLVAGKRKAADLRILVEAPVAIDDDSGRATIALPSAEVEGVHRASGTLALIGSDGVKVQSVETGAMTVPARDELAPAIRDHPHFVNGFRFPVLTDAPQVTLSPVTQRFNAQLDTLITLGRDAVHLRRELSVAPLEGRIFETVIELPAGEEISEVRWLEGEGKPDWSRIGGDDDDGAQGIRIEWSAGGLVPGAGAGRTVAIETRRDPDDWFNLGATPAELAFASAAVADAEALSGYVAVAFDESFRVETAATDGLEARDARGTPVSGQLAWFRLSDYSLELRASRRAPEVDAEITAYALPLQSTLEIEGQIDLKIRYTPLAQVVVSAPAEMAEQMRFDSPLIAEKSLDADSGEWTLTFHDEVIGEQRLRFHLSMPYGDEDSGEAEEEKADDPAERRFAVEVPVLAVAGTKRLRGQWLVEANTDTELKFESGGLDPIDLLRAPSIEGYSPRHRVIAAYAYRGDDYRLSISGTRHEAAPLVTAVVDDLRLDSVLSTDGLDRHQARIQLRTAGEQFLEVALPADAELWTLTVDGEAVKPVTSSAGTLRIALPVDAVGRAEVEIKVVYQIRRKRWGGSGRRDLEPVRLASRLPVLRSEWLLHLPEGFDYQGFKSNLSQDFEIVDRTLLGQAAGEWGRRSRSTDDLAEKASGYVVRLQERVMQADESALRGNAHMSDGNYEGSMVSFREALVLLPEAEMTRDRRVAYIAQYAAASVALARQRAQDGRYYDAIALVDSVLADDVAPGNRQARTLREQIMDPEIYPQAMTPELREKVRRIDSAIKSGFGAIDLGDYDAADRRFHQVLADDPYNEAARRGLEKVERAKLEYFQTARDQTRARFIREIEAGWELPVPMAVDEPAAETASAPVMVLASDGAEGIAAFESKLKSIILPSVEFSDTPLRLALEFLMQKSVELDVNEPDPGKKGINFVLQAGFGGDGVGDTPITLKLTNVPLVEAIRYTTSLAQLKYKVEPHAVVVVPLSTPDADLYTNVYKVPPSFLSPSSGAMAGGGAGPVDPFAPAASADSGGTALQARQTAKNVLEQYGVTFGEGSSAIYDPTTGQLIVRAPQDQMELVEASIESLADSAEDFEGPPMTRLALPDGNELTASDLGAFQELFESEQSFRDSVNADEAPLTAIENQLRQVIVPAVNFENLPVAEAIDQLSAQTGIPITVEGGHAAAGQAPAVVDTPITLKLENVPAVEALRYTANLAQMKYQVTASGIVIRPLSAPGDLRTLVVEVPASFFANGPDSPLLTARQLFERAGVSFPQGAGAAYNPATNRLAVKNTEDEMELVEAFLNSRHYEINRSGRAAGQRSGSRGESVVGLIPIDFELPAAGRSYRFEGLYAPQEIRFRYVNWERQVRLAWWWMLAGAIGFFYMSSRWKRPWFGGLAGVLVLSFVPLTLLPSLTAVCNAILIGWLVALALLAAWRLMNRFQVFQRESVKTAPAGVVETPQEVAS